MMRSLSAILWLALAHGALAAPVAVTSGEHPGFTRLVFDYGAAVNWHFGRSADGYEIEIEGPPPAYDLRGVFHPIGTTRLAAIWPAPDTGDLHIGIACACHAIPFEFRPGVIVVDLRDGPPPAGSSFEMMVDGSAAQALAPPPRPRPKARPRPAHYNWLAQKVEALPKPSDRGPPYANTAAPPDLTTEMALAPLRRLLLEQLSLGAAQGIVDMARPGTGPSSDLPRGFASAQVAIGGNRGSLDRPDQPPDGTLSATGGTCLGDDRLAISTWGDERPVAEQWSAAFTDLVGEFDRADPVALTRAVRFSLYLGFGAEARQMLEAFGTETADAPLWRAMSQVLDDETGQTGVLQGQTACDGPAALWSALAETGSLPRSANMAAIRRTFSALPPQLRQQLGPRLAQKFLQTGDTESARAIRDAIQRAAPENLGGAVALLGAEIESKTGDPATAERQLRQIAEAGGEGAIESLAGLVDLQARRGVPVRPSDVATLEGALSEWGEDRATLAEAVILGRAASGNPAGAFAMLPGHEGLEPSLWRLLADLGTDRQVLELAVLPDDRAPAAAPEAAARLAERLLQLGLPEPAARWMAAAPMQNPILSARIALANARPQDALALLKTQPGDEADALRAAALRQTGDDRAAARILAGRGQDSAAELALNRAGAWSDLAATGNSPLHSLAADVIRPAVPFPAKGTGNDGELARTRILLEGSETTRGHIDALLRQTPAS